MQREMPENTSDRLARLLQGYEEHILSHINEEYQTQTKRSDRLADRIAQFGGSWRFITIFAIFLALWMVWNSISATRSFHFDPVPFILLNLILSFTAAFQAPIIMMSQNRQAARDRREMITNYAINFKAEQEVDDIQAHLHRMEEAAQQLLVRTKEYETQFLSLKESTDEQWQEVVKELRDLKELLLVRQ